MKKKKQGQKAGTKITEKIFGNRKMLVTVLVLTAAVLGFAGTTLAKYYSSKYRSGVAVASGLYFNSNRLLQSEGDTTDINAIDTDGMMVNINDDKWAGGDVKFNIEVRNYDNNLLFNDENLNVGYEICFTLLDDPEGAAYFVQDTDAKELQLTRKGQVVKFTGGVLAGGTLSADSYILRINLEDKDTYNGARVLAVAYPTSPDYLLNPTKQQHRLVGIFQGVYSETEMRVEDAGFLVEEDTDYTDATWKQKVESLSGLIFNIKTIGDVVTDENNAVKQEAVVKWQSDYLTISQYDEYYQAAQKTGAIWSDTDALGNKWMYMKIEMLPYTNADLTFYKTEQFIQDFADDKIDRDMFEGMADAYTQEGQGN